MTFRTKLYVGIFAVLLGFGFNLWATKALADTATSTFDSIARIAGGAPTTNYNGLCNIAA